MSSETTFRVALVLLLIPTAAIGLYHRIRANSGERISHREEGYVFAAALRLAGLVLGISTLGYLFFSAPFRWATIPLPIWSRWLGFVIGASGPLLMYWTMSSLGRNLTDTVVTRADATLVTHGPYRWVRHPYYVTAAILILAVTLLTCNWMIGLSGFVVMTMLVVRVSKEEQMLIERFGSQYREYMRTTPRFFPHVRS
jgi:protein-S-isoprenylcysteine O-methyltransferase Ste14